MMNNPNKSNLMRKNKKRHNEKARQIADIVIDKREQEKIKLEITGKSIKPYDECNALVLPSKKRKTKKIQKVKLKPLLSKKKKKLLEKIVEKKIKKANRQTVLKDLNKLQVSSSDLDCLTSLQHNQTLGRKQFFQQDLEVNHIRDDTNRVPTEHLLKRFNVSKNCSGRPAKRIRYSNVVDTSSSEEEEDQIEINSVIHPDEPEKLSSVMCNALNNSNPVINVEDNNPVINVDDTPDIHVEDEIKPKVEIIPAAYKILNRLKEITEYRSQLPVVSMEYEIMTAIKENNIVIIDGSTGSGKTTQVPQFLYEAGFTKDGKCIAVTEPRRVAAIEMSKRVAYEMNLSQDEISYQIRFKGNTTKDTKIKFLTDGVLLKEFLADPILEKYSAVIIDEAHERSVFSDIMIGILSRVIKAREKMYNPLKLIVMSATMDEGSFTENRKLFSIPPPIVKVDSRMFDVAVHYNKVTNMDYSDEAYKKACRVHRQLPPGGILIFVTGKEEVLKLRKKLIKTFPKPKEDNPNKLSSYEEKMQAKKECSKNKNPELPVEKSAEDIPEIKLSDFSEENVEKLKEFETTVVTSGELEEDDEEDMSMTLMENDSCESEQALYVLPMYSMLASEKLQLVFEDPPPGTRLCVIATNIAETSLTIPNIVYVIDTGKIKGKVYNSNTGISKMEVMWSSKASAEQRKGRAGRVQNGHCYRLYSATVFTDLFAKHAPADILRRPVDDVVLAMKTRKIPVMNFPYITPPHVEELYGSIKRLKMLGALCEPQPMPGKDLSKITPFGRKMCLLPVSPRFSKMIIESFVYPELTPYFILLVCGLTVQEVIQEPPKMVENSLKEASKLKDFRISWLGDGMSRYLGDLMILMSGLLKAEKASDSKKFCDNNGIRYKAFQEIRKLRRQITNEANLIFPDLNVPIFPEFDTFSNSQSNMMRKIILKGSLDRIAKKVHDHEIKEESLKKKYYNAYRIPSSEEPIFLHFSSPFRNEFPNWVVFQEIYEVNGKKIMRAVSTIEPQWIAQIAPEMCIFSDPLSTPSPRYNAEEDKVVCHQTVTFGPQHWIIPRAEYTFPYIPKVYDWFAYFFLGGEVCSLLKPFANKLYDFTSLISPIAVRHSNLRSGINKGLMKREIISFEKLKETWQSNPKYLLSEYLSWLQDHTYREKIEKLWPPYEKNDESWS